MAIIDFTIHVDSAGNISSLYDRIQVWRSPDNVVEYLDITANEATSAVIDGTVDGPWNLSGKTLNVIHDGADAMPVVFSGSDPLALSSVIDQINAVFPTLASEVPTNTNKIRLTSAHTGTASILELSGNAAASLGLSTVRANGKGPRPLLAATIEDYVFQDFDGADNYYYKTRYFNSTTEAASSFSDPHQGNPTTDFPSGVFLKCFIYLANGAGEPIVGRRVFLVPTQQVQVTDNGGNIYGVLSSVDRIVLTTDEIGYAESNLIRGQTFKMFIEGTPFQREVTIPSTGTELNLLVAASTADDPFTIVTVPPMLIRMS